jgi:DNA-directed RNA polymerase subunit RPC12/RpoP
MRRPRRRDMPGWLLLLFVVAFLITIPVWLPCVFVWRAMHKLRLRKAANRFVCVNCGKTLGVEALRLADREWGEYVQKLMHDNPGVKFRLVRTLDAICPACGTRYSFRERERTFVLEERANRVAAREENDATPSESAAQGSR